MREVGFKTALQSIKAADKGYMYTVDKAPTSLHLNTNKLTSHPESGTTLVVERYNTPARIVARGLPAGKRNFLYWAHVGVVASAEAPKIEDYYEMSIYAAEYQLRLREVTLDDELVHTKGVDDIISYSRFEEIKGEFREEITVDTKRDFVRLVHALVSSNKLLDFAAIVGDIDRRVSDAEVAASDLVSEPPSPLFSLAPLPVLTNVFFSSFLPFGRLWAVPPLLPPPLTFAVNARIEKLPQTSRTDSRLPRVRRLGNVAARERKRTRGTARRAVTTAAGRAAWTAERRRTRRIRKIGSTF